MLQQQEDLYQILGVAPDASAATIKEAYLYKVQILHPDRLQAGPAKVRIRAEEDLKRVNEAYGILSNPEKRSEYDIRRGTSKARQRKQTTKVKPPKPEVHPKEVIFRNASPSQKMQDSFLVTNTGGPFKKVLISAPPKWVKILKTTPVKSVTKLPMYVLLEVQGSQWGKDYSSEIRIRLDDIEERVKITLQMKKAPSISKVHTSDSLVCPRCNAHVSDEDRFCISCGETLFEIVGYYCSVCGKDVEDSWDVCPNCGELL